MATETLSEYLERDITSECLSGIKQKVQDKYRYVPWVVTSVSFVLSFQRFWGSYFGSQVGSLRKHPTFGDATIGFHSKWRLRNEHRYFILLGTAFDWLVEASFPSGTVKEEKYWISNQAIQKCSDILCTLRLFFKKAWPWKIQKGFHVASLANS